jgi:hypothetical protein
MMRAITAKNNTELYRLRKTEVLIKLTTAKSHVDLLIIVIYFNAPN